MDSLMVIAVIVGIMIGSFLNVCIYRIPKKESINFPRSHCTRCGHVLSALELIPIISYLALGRKCKQCKEPISPRYMWIELITGLGFGMIYYQYGYSLESLLYMTFFCFGIVLTMIDWDYMLLPTSIIRWGFGVGLLERIIQSLMANSWHILIESLLGAAVGYGLFMLVYYGSKWLLKKEGLGYGDVRLMGFIGLFVGLNALFLMIIIACILASVFGLILLKVKKKSEPYPLGPFLNIGAFIVVLWGSQLLQSYLSLFNL